MIRVKASVSIRLKTGKFPQASYRRALISVRPSFAQDVRVAFAREADPVTGKPWEKRKNSRLTHPILQLSGRMAREAVKAAETARVNGSTLYARQTRPKYAKWHATGTRKMARRRSLGVSPGTAQKLRRALAGEGVRVFRNARVD
jgi:hypothetical protein